MLWFRRHRGWFLPRGSASCGMMIGCAAATGLSEREERVRVTAAARGHRPGQGRGDPGAASPGHGPAAAAGHGPATVLPVRPGVPGRLADWLAAGGCHGSWYVRLELPAGLDGHRRRIRRGGYPSRKAAMAVLARLRSPRPGDGTDAVVTVGTGWRTGWSPAPPGPPPPSAATPRTSACTWTRTWGRCCWRS